MCIAADMATSHVYIWLQRHIGSRSRNSGEEDVYGIVGSSYEAQLKYPLHQYYGL